MVAIFGNHKTARAALGDSEPFSSRLNPGGSGARAIFTAPAPEPSRKRAEPSRGNTTSKDILRPKGVNSGACLRVHNIMNFNTSLKVLGECWLICHVSGKAQKLETRNREIGPQTCLNFYPESDMG